MSQYYDLAWLSWRALVNEKMARNDSGWRLEELMESDERHPNDRGHTYASIPYHTRPQPPLTFYILYVNAFDTCAQHHLQITVIWHTTSYTSMSTGGLCRIFVYIYYN